MKSTMVNAIWITLAMLLSVGFKTNYQYTDTSAKIYLYQNYLIKTHPEKGIQIFSVSNPSIPTTINTMNVVGTHDVAVINNKMYTDRWNSLIVYDVSNFSQPKQIDSIPQIFNSYRYDVMPMGIDGNVDDDNHWSCGDCIPAPRSTDAVTTTAVQSGQGGSLARFIIVDNYLYCIDLSSLVVFSIADSGKPVYRNRVEIGWDIETIFSKDSLLFIGGRNGMYIYNVFQPEKPVQLSQFRHSRGCDPVVVNDTVAYVTIRDGNTCGAGSNQLLIIGVGDLKNPVLLSTYQFANPYGLAIDNKHLYLCDGTQGLKIYDVKNYVTLEQKTIVKDIIPHDVIIHNGILYVIANNQVLLYSITDPVTPILLSTIQ
ncbi:MAG: hypothetical protein Q8L88_04325 [Bacteroidota bacterium]|nr:hypothetical protein [Bacteroidota bacterium]